MTTVAALLQDRRFQLDALLSMVAALALAVLYVSASPAAAATTLLLGGALSLRRVQPALALGVGCFAAVLQLLTVGYPTVGIVLVPLLVYSAARWGGRELGRLALLVALLGALLGPARWALQVGYQGSAVIYFAMGVIGCGGIVLAAYLVGVRRREGAEVAREREMSEVERAQLMVAEQQQRAVVAAVDERNRIARELHDIVAHSLSVIVVQAEGGKALATKRPEQAPEVLGTIAETSRLALEEMRRMVGLLRSGGSQDEQTSYVPTPGLEDVPELVARTSGSAELVVFGDVPVVSPALGLTAYRIIQESLTNVLKHAGPDARTRVILAFTAAAVEIEVSDDGRGEAAEDDGLGHGRQGMAERVALHGGTLSTGPRPGGGFSVRALLPLIETHPTVPGGLS